MWSLLQLGLCDGCGYIKEGLQVACVFSKLVRLCLDGTRHLITSLFTCVLLSALIHQKQVEVIDGSPPSAIIFESCLTHWEHRLCLNVKTVCFTRCHCS